ALQAERLRSRDPRGLARNAGLHRRRARLQTGLGSRQLQEKIRRLATLRRECPTPSAIARGALLGALPHDRIRERQGPRMNKKRQIDGNYVPHTREVLEAPAWRVLSLSGHRVLDRLEIEHLRHGGKDNGELPVTFNNFEAYGIHRHAIAPALRECAALGLV